MMKLLVCISLVLTCVAAEYECTPGTYFKMGCNTCFCSNDGKILACTEIACPPKGKTNIIRIDSSQDYKKQECTPGTTYNDYCNVCSCIADGSAYACTMMYCDKNVWNKDGSIKDIALSQKSQNGNKVCTPGSKYNDYCNVCICSDDGATAMCTAMFCEENIWNKDGSRKDLALIEKFNNENKQVCTPGATFNDYCNVCFCLADGSNFICTIKFCDKDLWNKDGSRKDSPALTQNLQNENKQVCTPGATFNDYCNVCFCLADGSNFICTIKFCDKDLWNKDGSRKDLALTYTPQNDKFCEPGKAFSPDDCNTCVCNKYGTEAACTYKICLGNFKAMYQVTNEENWGPLYKEGDACTPGKAFYSECNRCVCTESGRSAFCTLMSCQRSP